MDSCPLCQHPKIQAINDAMDSGRYVGVIARQFRLDLLELDKHREHRRPNHGQRGVYVVDGSKPGQVMSPMLDGQVMVDQDDEQECLCYWCEMSGYQRLLRAWQEANDLEKQRFCVDTRTMDIPF